MADPAKQAKSTSSARVWINSTELYVTISTFSINSNIKVFEHLKHGFKEQYRGTNTGLK